MVLHHLYHHHRFRFFVLIFITFVTFRTSHSIQTPIKPGSSLSASNRNETWTSPNSTFFFGFLSSAAETGKFSASVFYSGNVPVWSASVNGSPILVDSEASILFDSSGELILRSSSGNSLWSSATSGRRVSSLFLDDAGNLILRNSSSGAVWSTFDHPSDALIPGMSFGVRSSLRSGLYSLRLETSGNLTLRWNNTIRYWNQGLNSSYAKNLSSPTLGLQGIGILSISDASFATPGIFAYSNDYAEGSDILRFLKLDGDGNLRIYSSALGSSDVIERWTAVTDQCEVFGYCGNMGVCSYNESSPVCGCPSRNFEPVDPKDRRKGCRRKVEIADCPGSATMLDLAHTRFLTFSPEYEQQVFFVGISACRLNCMVSGSCDASTSLSDGTGLCFYKTPGFLSAYRSPAMTSSSYIKVCGPTSPNLSGGGGRRGEVPGWVLAVAVVAAVAGLAAAEAGLWWWFCRNGTALGGLSAHYALLEYASGAPVQFTLRELHRATKGFSERLGSGGFGAVYKGTLANKTAAAVKRLEGIEQGERQFRMEVATISSTHHLNLVRLIGFCSEGRHRLLVYEFMKNGSLDAFLFPPPTMTDPPALPWEQRFGVALGTARGITYLHEECRDCIVHCDIKPENILLDEAYSAKVSDFGLAKLVNPKDHRYRTLKSVRGTRGYLAPEWLANLPITSKSDVYSYGMVVLEIVSGRRNFDVSADTDHKRFSVWAYEEYERGNMAGIVDPRLGSDGAVDLEQVRRAMEVGFWCIQEQPTHRPTMGKVVQMLEGIMEIERPPPPRLTASEAGSTSSVCGGTSVRVSSNTSALSTLATSAPAASSASSFQTAGPSPSVVSSSSGYKPSDKPSSSLLQ